jgi:dehydrogenase/reductase SDR family protein 1
MVARHRTPRLSTVVAHAGVSDPAELTAVVTGAARGLGREIAVALGGLGATVYVTDCAPRRWDASEPPGTVEETAVQVSECGGRGLPVTVDHADDDAVAGVFERIRAERGRLDLLIANAVDGPVPPFHGGPFWTIPLEQWQDLFGRGVRGQLVAARLAAPLLAARGGLIVLTCYHDPDAEILAEHLFLDVAMNAVSRLARGLAHDLRPHGVTALALAVGIGAASRSDSAGSAVRVLLQDTEVERHAGRTIPIADLAEQYGFRAGPAPGQAESPALGPGWEAR